MPRFDIHRNPFPAGRAHTPGVRDLQNDHLAGLATRMVAPLRTEHGHGRPAHDLNPLITVPGQALVPDTASLAPVRVRLLARPVGQVGTQRGDVVSALVALFGAH